MLSLFERVLLEAEGDENEIPDIGAIQQDDTQDDVLNDDPPDVLDSPLDDQSYTDDEYDDINIDADNPEDSNQPENLDINEKISAVMNANLYQKFLSLISVVSDHLSMIKNHRDKIYTIAPNAIEIEESLKKLKENINLYLANNFINNNYSSNLLFFNKCYNLLNLLDMNFAKKIKNNS